jgi:hypothetical protein
MDASRPNDFIEISGSKMRKLAAQGAKPCDVSGDNDVVYVYICTILYEILGICTICINIYVCICIYVFCNIRYVCMNM